MTFHRQRLCAVCFSCTPCNLVSHADRQHARTRAKTHARTRDMVNVVHDIIARGRYREPLGAKVKFEEKAV